MLGKELSIDEKSNTSFLKHGEDGSVESIDTSSHPAGTRDKGLLYSDEHVTGS